MRQKNILLIDDNKNEKNNFVQALKNLNIFHIYDCIYANSARQGVRILNCILPEMIFVDMNMPRQNGLECLEMIKKRTPAKNTPVIIYANGVNNLLVQAAMEMGASCFIKKPNSLPALEQLLRALLIPSQPVNKTLAEKHPAAYQ
jgi:DNA-binding NtrC family response regulator